MDGREKVSKSRYGITNPNHDFALDFKRIFHRFLIARFAVWRARREPKAAARTRVKVNDMMRKK